MGKDTARPTPEKETVKKETGKQEGALKDDELKDVTGAGLDSYVLRRYRERFGDGGGGS